MKTYEDMGAAFDAILEAFLAEQDIIDALQAEESAKREDGWIGPTAMRIIREWHSQSVDKRQADWAMALRNGGWTTEGWNAELDRRTRYDMSNEKRNADKMPPVVVGQTVWALDYAAEEPQLED